MDQASPPIHSLDTWKAIKQSNTTMHGLETGAQNFYILDKKGNTRLPWGENRSLRQKIIQGLTLHTLNRWQRKSEQKQGQTVRSDQRTKMPVDCTGFHISLICSCWLLAWCLSNMLVYLRDRSAQLLLLCISETDLLNCYCCVSQMDLLRQLLLQCISETDLLWQLLLLCISETDLLRQ